MAANGGSQCTIPLVSVAPNYGSAVGHNAVQNLINDPFGENYQADSDFWKNVSQCFRANEGRVQWVDVEMKFRLQRLQNTHNINEKDTLIELMTNIYDNFCNYATTYGSEEILESFKKQLTEFASILLREDYNGYPSFPLDGNQERFSELKEKSKGRTDNDRKYANLQPFFNNDEKTSILHLAAQRNLTDIAAVFLELYPPKVCKDDSPSENSSVPARIPLEWGLEKQHDDVSCLLVKHMLNERVRRLFEGSENNAADYCLGDLIKSRKMTKTVTAILDACINPSFPFIVQDPEQKEREEEAWSKMPTIPLRYNFFFQILDGDNEAKPAKVFDESLAQDRFNRNFNSFKVSALQLLADHADYEDANCSVKHPTVRQLVRQKWESYGKRILTIQTIIFLFFLLALSVSLGLAAKLSDPTEYKTSTDKFRYFCEIVALIFACLYILLEIEQFVRSPSSYLEDKYTNALDIAGLLAIIAILPCRYADALTVSRSISVIAFFINYMRIFQYLILLETLGVYAKTFGKIIRTDIVKFLCIFGIVCIGFAGSVYLTFAASKSFNSDFSNFWDVLLQELRAMFEGKEFSDSYKDYHPAFTLFLILNMFFIIIILSNLLIAQVSNRYTDAQAEATIQYDIDKLKMLCTIDRSLLFYKFRIWHYKPGIFVSNQELVSDLLRDWNQVTKNEETDQAILGMLRKRILKKSNVSLK